MPKAKKLRASLSPDQQAFFTSKTIHDTKKIKEWIAFFQNIAIIDKKEDGTRKLLMRLGIAFIILGVICVIATFITENLLILIATALLVTVGVIFLVKVKKLKAQGINNYLRLFFMPILEVLQGKAGPNARLSANLDFHEPRDMEPTKSQVRGRSQSLYSPTYVMAKVTLLDQVKLQFGIQDDVKDLVWSKTSASGKMKRKMKTKTTHHGLVKMILPADQYTWNQTTGDDMGIVAQEETFEAKKKLKVKVVGDHILSVKYLFEAIEDIYAQFTPIGEQQIRQREDDGTDHFDDGDAMVAAYVWHGTYFDRYDYDSVDYQDPSDMSYEDDEGTVFDS